MDKLLDAYDFMAHYQKRNKPVPKDVLDEAMEAETNWLQKELVAAFQKHIQPILDKIQSELTVICEHRPNEAPQISITREKDITSLLDDAVVLSNSLPMNMDEDKVQEPQTMNEEAVVEDEFDEEEIDEEDDINNPQSSGKAKSIGFTVRFEDGKVVSRTKAKDTMIDTFEHMGFDKVATFRGKTIKGFHIVDRRKRTDKGGVWQEGVQDGWFVYTNMANSTKKKVIQQIANFLGVKLTIFDNIESGLFQPSDKAYAPRPRALFSLNGKSPKDKRNSVLDVVKAYASTRPNATFKEMLRSFPDQLQGSYGVIKSLDEIEERRRRGQQVANRYFLDPRDILISSDGVEYAVCNQWGDQFHQFQEHVKNFGWALTEV